MKHATSHRAAPFALALLAGACGGEAADPAGDGAARRDARVVDVRMVTDERGNRFDPAQVIARPGDVVRFILVTGVHNVSFPSARNPAWAPLPPPSPLLEAAGHAVKVRVDFPPGEYGFVCDPHVDLGMVGTLTVR